jgi:membrane-associated phospholipid phosphatase
MSPAAPRASRVARSRALGVALAIAALAASSKQALAAEPCFEASPWSRLGRSGKHFVRPVPLTLTALAVLTPVGFAPSGLDQQARLVAQRDLFGKPRLEPVSVWTPYVLAGGVFVAYGVSVALDSCAARRALSPVIQAGTLTFVTVGLLKFGVGRQWPNGGSNPNAPDRLEHPARAREFEPFQHVYAAWPSGHTALMFAGAAAFRASNPELGLASWLGYPLAVGVAGGMWLGDHHWASDIVSGALLGEAIGSSVGQSFSEALGVPGALVLSPTQGNGFSAQWFTLW